MQFDNIHHESEDYHIVLVPCPCVSDIGKPNPNCLYCGGFGRLQYSVFDLVFVADDEFKTTGLDQE